MTNGVIEAAPRRHYFATLQDDDAAAAPARNVHYEALDAWSAHGSYRGQPQRPPFCGWGRDALGEQRHTFDGCGSSAVPRAQLYAQDAGDAAEVNPRDVQQRRIGDCYFVASVAALATTEAGRALLRACISTDTDDGGHVVAYTVTLRERDTDWKNRWNLATTFHEKKIVVTADFPEGSASATQRGGEAKTAPEIWPLVLEKAFAQMRGGYDVIKRGGFADDGLSALTGKPTPSHSPGFFYGGAALLRDLSAGKALVAGSAEGLRPGSPDDPEGVHGSHAYAVTGAYRKDGEVYVRLQNPWGREDPPDLPYARFKELFAYVAVGTP